MWLVAFSNSKDGWILRAYWVVTLLEWEVHTKESEKKRRLLLPESNSWWTAPFWKVIRYHLSREISYVSGRICTHNSLQIEAAELAYKSSLRLESMENLWYIIYWYIYIYNIHILCHIIMLHVQVRSSVAFFFRICFHTQPRCRTGATRQHGTSFFATTSTSEWQGDLQHLAAMNSDLQNKRPMVNIVFICFYTC